MAARSRSTLPSLGKKQKKYRPATYWSGSELIVNEDDEFIEFFIPVRLPGMNEILTLAKRGRGLHNAYAREKKYIEYELRTLFSKRLPNFKRCLIGFHWVEPDRRRDLDNISAGRKFILDALVKSGVIADDSWKCVRGFLPEQFSVNKQAFGVWVRMEAC